ncbi:adenylate/guanylate cyclase domain-containing protein [uncultured Roseobacter sp.]|uniref:adenylate/guanylate cyclase domain-containing protein n=1 Tax=uncultured Roseobacter sp. TaxID=114847 RepID=UPI002618F466|nr:adenylate/guanylate cyclase domain-containing protein [uncultured Roseobacter sp.]
MSIEAINEQLLRAIGVGVALVDLEKMTLGFRNDTFAEWFGPQDNASQLVDLFPALDITALHEGLKSTGQHTTEASFKLRRRTMTVAMEFNRTVDTGGPIAVLVCQNITRIKELESMIDSYSVMVERNTREIKREKDQVEKLLLDMMPRSAYEEYKSFGIVAPRVFEPVSVLALDFVGFDPLIAKHEPGVIVSELNDIYSALDRIGEQFGCQRIRTHGDSYISVSGVPDPEPEHVTAVANAAVRFLRYLKQRNESHPIKWQPRIGIATGNVIGSVVGVQRYIYDVFGPAVSRALALRQAAQPASILGEASISSLLDETFETTNCPDINGVATVCVSEQSAAAPATG